MTEARIDALLAFLEAERADLIRIAGLLGAHAELLAASGYPGVGAEVGQLAADLGCKVPVIDRLIGKPADADAEITQPILVSTDAEICTRCHGTGEVPVIE